MKLTFDRLVFTVIALAAAALFASTFSPDYDVPSFGGDVSTVFTPRIFLALIFLLSVLLLVTGTASGDPRERLTSREVVKLLGVAAVSLVVAFALPGAGFVAAASPGMFLFCLLFGYRRLPVLILNSLIGPFAVWYLFSRLLELPLPDTNWISF